MRIMPLDNGPVKGFPRCFHIVRRRTPNQMIRNGSGKKDSQPAHRGRSMGLQVLTGRAGATFGCCVECPTLAHLI
jgi:hypothetical protein